MPKVVDHAARRGQVARAVERIIDRQGLDGVTVARVAAEAGISVGLVQHYFGNKDDMLSFTFTRIVERVQARVAERVACDNPAGETIATMVLAGLAELLPLDDDRRAEYRVTLAFLGRTVDDPRLRDTWTAARGTMLRQVVQAIGNGTECGEVADAPQAERQALRIVSLVDGLALAAYSDPEAVSPDAVLGALRAELATVFTGECRHWRRLQRGR